MAITLRSTKGTQLTHNELDTNFTTPYISSSIDGSTLKLFTHGTGSFSATTHSLEVGSALYKESITGYSSYTITHNLDEDYPIVQTYSGSNEQVVPASIVSTDSNTTNITFDTTFVGTVVIKK